MGTDPHAALRQFRPVRTITKYLFVDRRADATDGGCTNGTLTFVALSLRSAVKISEVM
jgi:hypothetical protein